MAKKRAIKERLILRNPTEDCIAPKVQKFEMQILPPEHIKDYLDAADKRGLLPMFYLELVTGLRKGRSRHFSGATSTSKTKPSPSASSMSKILTES